MKALLLSLLLVVGLGAAGPACIVVHDDHHRHPVYCEYECDADFIVWACDDGYSEDVEDCWDLCDGTCAYVDGDAACVCP